MRTSTLVRSALAILTVLAAIAALAGPAPAGAREPAPLEMGSSDWRRLSSGDDHTCGLRTTGRLYCWGLDDFGQLGNDGGGGQTTPGEVLPSVSTWSAVSSGGDHTCGLRTTGRLYCWGRDTWGQLGDGGTADQAAEARAWSHVGHVAHDLGRFGWWGEGVALLEQMPTPGSALTRARADFLRAGARDDGDGLDGASEAFVALGATLFAAEASACASAAHRRSGARRRATAAAGRMTALLAAVPGAATPPLRLSGGADLTAREQEVATMAASGRSNRDIAADLGITERTVENHLHRALAKLGVGARAELRAALDAREALRRR